MVFFFLIGISLANTQFFCFYEKNIELHFDEYCKCRNDDSCFSLSSGLNKFRHDFNLSDPYYQKTLEFIDSFAHGDEKEMIFLSTQLIKTPRAIKMLRAFEDIHLSLYGKNKVKDQYTNRLEQEYSSFVKIIENVIKNKPEDKIRYAQKKEIPKKTVVKSFIIPKKKFSYSTIHKKNSSIWSILSKKYREFFFRN